MIQTELFFEVAGVAEASYTRSAKERPAWYSFGLQLEVTDTGL